MAGFSWASWREVAIRLESRLEETNGAVTVYDDFPPHMIPYEDVKHCIIKYILVRHGSMVYK